jgi:cysteine-rich repeat protein
MRGGVVRWTLAGAFALGAFGGCFTPAFSEHPMCGPGGACPASMQCLRDVCVPNGCDRAVDGDPCANAGVEDGVCHRGDCVVRGCGDGIVGLDATGRPEMCDDGNQVGGDGCSADCLSDETCGNGVVDHITGEACDDGVPGRSGDGCSSRCTVELLDWRPVPVPELTPRLNAAMTFDARRHRVVLFGGITRRFFADIPLSDTWEYDGANWSRPSLPTQPPAGQGAAMAFDAAHGEAVMVDTVRGDTWTYNGAMWRRLPTGPTAFAAGHAMAYDAARGRVIVFDGASEGATWEFDGAAWSRLATLHRPPAVRSAMAFDDDRGHLALYNGAELWELDDDWQLRARFPAAAGAPSLVFDAGRHRLIATSGQGASAATYEVSGVSWESMALADPPARVGASQVFDSARQVTVRFGGADPTNREAVFNDTWELDATGWNLRPRAPELAPASGGVMTFDPGRGTAVVFRAGDTWELDAASWHLRLGAGGPDAACSGAVIAFDDRRHRTVLLVRCPTETQTWTFDGAVWTRLPTAHTPGPSSGITGGLAMVYDATHDRVVLFDGPNAQTWLFDGTDWTLGPNGPGARFGQVLAFDAARGVTVLFSGTQDTEDGKVSFSDTWELDGSAWSSRGTPHRPPPRFAPGLAYDRDRARIVLYGGGPNNPSDGRQILSDTWEYDGTDWTPRATVNAPPPLAGPVPVIYDSARRRIVLGRTWTLSFVSAVPAELCIAGVDTDGDGLAGCADPDCAGVCAQCGDHVCNDVLEGAVCPLDCGP